jgi:amino acid adenylation domain-containing protein
MIASQPEPTDPSLQALYRRFNNTERAFSDSLTLPELVRQRACSHPEAIAVLASDGEMTYRRLINAANQVSEQLQSAGIMTGMRVGVCCQRSLDLPAILLGIMQAGVPYVPLDPDYPLQRLKAIADDAELEMVIGHRALQPVIDQLDIARQLIDPLAYPAMIARETPPPCSPDHHAYVIHTSGSTGKPKGVAISQRSLANLMHGLIELLNFGPGQRMLAAASLAFDMSVLELFLPLSAGGSVALVSRQISRDPVAINRAIKHKSITDMIATPSQWRMLLDAGFGGHAQLRCFSGGEALPPTLARELLGVSHQLWNLYGPTEATVVTTAQQIIDREQPITIGRPLANYHLYVVDQQMQLCPAGIAGELLIGGLGLADGYINRPTLTAERFIEWHGERVYRSGDRCRLTAAGDLQHLGRLDQQIKLHGYRIELEEIETHLTRHPDVEQAAVLVREDLPSGGPQLIAYLVLSRDSSLQLDQLADSLRDKLPSYMVPSRYVVMESFPVTPSGKRDHQSFPVPPAERPPHLARPLPPRNPLEQRLVKLFESVLGYAPVGAEDPFFQAGGNSLRAVTLVQAIKQNLGLVVSLPELYDLPTVASLAERLGARSQSNRSDLDHFEAAGQKSPSARPIQARGSAERFAIVGLASRLPGAENVEQFWANLVHGRESITRFDQQTIDPSLDRALTEHPRYVPARGIIEQADCFDCRFFGDPPKTAELIDPQQRVLLELAWHALEDAGVKLNLDRAATPQSNNSPSDPEEPTIGIWAGTYSTSYWHHHLMTRPDRLSEAEPFTIGMLNEKDYVATRIAHKLNLTGPAISLNTACSTSLVAVIQACQGLAAGHCQIALAGGVSIHFPQASGHLHQPGSIFSADGHCRPFDVQATGTIFSDGAGLVVLKRLEDAQAARDRIYAVIIGQGLNNDGHHKASFSAPSRRGQAAAVSMAIEQAKVPPESIGYVEAHGTGTPVGDPIEIAALRQVFAPQGTDRPWCAIGSVKSNIGHTVAAAGVVGLIKTALALHHEQIPPSLNFHQPNPALELCHSPFFVCDQLRAWPRSNTPRRAGVSSLGVGGTNAHALLEEAPLPAGANGAACISLGEQRPESQVSRTASFSVTAETIEYHLLPISAKSPMALKLSLQRLADYLQLHPEVSLRDVAYTLQEGRTELPYRAWVLASDHASAIEQLRRQAADHPPQAPLASNSPPIAFQFPGQGAQFLGMGRDLYARHARFRNVIDAGCQLLQPEIGLDLRQLLLHAGQDDASATRRLTQTAITQPAMFLIGCGLAEVLESCGIMPEAMLGHSIGELVAAYRAAVLSFDDALTLIAKRGSAMQSLPPGGMLTVRLPADQVLPRLPDGIDLAAINGPQLCVVAGPVAQLAAFQTHLEASGIACRALHTSHAFHSAMMRPAVEPFRQFVTSLRLQAPQIPIVSTVTGQWLTASEARDPRYWAEHMLRPVRYADAVQHLWRDEPQRLLIELGPRSTLTSLAQQQRPQAAQQDSPTPTPVSLLGSSAEPGEQWLSLLGALGKLWSQGVRIRWSGIYPDRGRIVSLPGYPFERRPLLVAAGRVSPPTSTPATEGSLVPMYEALPCGNAPSQLSSNSMTDNHTMVPEKLTKKVADLIEETCGIEIDRTHHQTNFMELGLDSLVLTQAARAIGQACGVELTLRQLLEQANHLSSLVGLIAEQLPPEHPFRETAAGETPTAATGCSSSPSSSTTSPASVLASSNEPAVSGPERPPSRATNAVQPAHATASAALAEGIIAQQLEVMRLQLAWLSGKSPPSSLLECSTANQASSAPSPLTPSATVEGSSSDNGQLAAAEVVSRGVTGQPTAVAPPAPAPKPFGAAPRIDLRGASDDPSLQAAVERQVAAYLERTPGSRAQTQSHRRYLADPRSVSGFRPQYKEMTYPIVVERSAGCRLWDVDGNEYLDFTCGFGSNLLGHSPPLMVEAISDQLQKDYSIGPQTPLAGMVARRICDMTGSERVAFANTGSEAVLAATRLARNYTGRNLIVMFDGDYHGIFDEVVARSTPRGGSFPAASGIPREHVSQTLILEYGAERSLEIIRQRLPELAAVVVEPVQSRRPALQPKRFLQALAHITEPTDTALIFDEIITGFRIGPGGAQTHFGVRADMATYGKVIGGGLPIGVVAGRAKYLDGMDGGFWQYGDDSRPEAGMTYFAGTFMRHPLAMAAANAILGHLQEQGQPLYDQLNRLSETLVIRLNELFEHLAVPLQVAHFGSLFKIECRQPLTHAELIFAGLRRRGIFLWDHRAGFLTTSHTESEIDALVDRFAATLAELIDAKLIPGRSSSHRSIPCPAPGGVLCQPVPGVARHGKDKAGRPGWFVRDPANPGRFMQVDSPLPIAGGETHA